MSLNIIIDKSTFQSLSYIELVRLNNYYKHNVAPVLVMEILGDLKKEVAEGKTPSDVRVKDFARKLFPTRCIVNTYYRNLLKQELEGKPCELDGRPTLDLEKIVKADDGRKGFVIKETEEEKSIYKWKEGNFSEADHELSELWRTITTKEDLLKNLQKIIQSGDNEKLKSFDKLISRVDEILNNDNIQDRLLAFAIDVYGEEGLDGKIVFQNWLKKGRPRLLEFTPFVAHCLKVDLLFHLGLKSELIGTRPTNRVDLEYINEYLEKNGKEAIKKFGFKPPLINESLTFNLWKEYFNYPTALSFREISEKEKSNAKEQIDKFIKAMEGEPTEFSKGESEEFIVKKSSLSATDPCFCGSGEKVIDCCIPKEEFFRISKEQREKNN